MKLRNPLAPIRNGLEVMRLAHDDPVVVTKVRNMMERQLVQMIHLVNDLLDVARITRGKMELQKERVELKTVVSSAVETSLPLIEYAHHTLEMRIPNEPLPLYADPTRISQVVSNLLSNAAKYTPNGGCIKLLAWRDGDEVVIAVTDTGVGIPRESLSTVFGMFNQVGRHIGRAQGGLGIGLSLVRPLVEMHGGRVSASSAGAGKGSTFTVHLPLALLDEKRDPCSITQDGVPEGVATRHFRILVVDDNKDAADSFSQLLGLGGHQVALANNGFRALEIVRELRPEVVFLDIGMPGMSGYEVAPALRSIPGMEHTVIVALTGWGAEEDRSRTRKAGFDRHLTKPAELGVVFRLLLELAQSENPDQLSRETSAR